ncbi:MAG: hypothetical protein U1E65_06355 [Myxococcota bacterium]
MLSIRARILGLFCLVAGGCSDPAKVTLDRSHDLVACTGSPRCVTYRGVAGISMGGGAAARIALENPGLFDVVGSLGSPYLDLEYFFSSVSDASGGGFCAPTQLLAHLDEIDQKDNPDTWCGPVPFGDLALPGTSCGGFNQDFNHQYRGAPAGRGGSFDRVESFQIVFDLALAYGNPAYYNAESKYLPPGVPSDHRVPLGLEAKGKEAERAAKWADLCAHPVTLSNFHQATYNPNGEYPVITFCDGNGRVDGEYEPGTHTFPFEVALAVDYNRNGVRDYGEPVISSSLEHFDDFGVDGKKDADEPGYDAVQNPDPSHDDYDWLTNPTGTEHNYHFDPGETYQDFGLDGVPNTADYGEGNGSYTINPNVAYGISRSPRQLLEKLDDAMLDRLHIWSDAGIRDFLYSAQITNRFFGSLIHRRPNISKLYTDWEGLRATTGPSEGSYDPVLADLSEGKIGRHAYLRYGDASVCPGIDAVEGRGNHVGPPWEVLNRIETMFAFASARFHNGDKKALVGDLTELGGPTGSVGDYVLVSSYQSPALGREQPYVVVLPPDYYLHKEERYPVLYFLHGQGQKAEDLAASALLFLSPEMGSKDPAKAQRGESDWQKMIVVFADGQCHPGECYTGTFYVDFVGEDGHGAQHGEAFFELMRQVEANFRTKAPEILPE